MRRREPPTPSTLEPSETAGTAARRREGMAGLRDDRVPLRLLPLFFPAGWCFS
ncbi:hypothetical protein [Streptomyces xantholiticus]|uniref:hypothetical protein n=1 Tax=Streptomyces xantholiticus TaxID=68285 RepID=UPI001671BC90|nr:hypothetical protein [Streptomyces xantholiticus]